jgi:phosphoserine/homoserine phosphotransferase
VWGKDPAGMQNAMVFRRSGDAVRSPTRGARLSQEIHVLTEPCGDEMKIACVSLEGVLAPRIWEELAGVAGIPGLGHDSPAPAGFRECMQRRVSLLREHGMRLDDLQFIASMFNPLKGANAFIQSLQEEGYRIVLLSDAFPEVATHFTTSFGEVEILCPHLAVNDAGLVEASDAALSLYSKKDTVAAFIRKGHDVLAIGHSIHDIDMLRAASHGVLYRPAPATKTAAPDLHVCTTYRELHNFRSFSVISHMFHATGGHGRLSLQMGF